MTGSTLSWADRRRLLVALPSGLARACLLGGKGASLDRMPVEDGATAPDDPG